MSNPIESFLAQRPVIVLDGALATELETRGADLADPLWSAKCLLERPALIHDVHLDYFLAGADVATTATYQATFEAFGRRGMTHEAGARLMVDAVQLARDARDVFWSDVTHRAGRLHPLVAASVGPYGAMLADGSEYRGRYAASDRELADFHRPRLRALAGSGADLLACETLPCLREALVIARLLEELPGMSAWISFSCRDGAHNAEGEAIGDCAAALADFPAVAAMGVNCTAPQYVGDLLEAMRVRAGGKPLLAYPNSGETYDAGSKTWSGHACGVSFVDQSEAWYEAGARLIGGCCRTTPADIRDLRERYAANARAPS